MPINIRPLRHSLQAILVITPDWSSTQGKLQYFERTAPQQAWQAKSPLIPVVVGTHGLGWDVKFKPWQKKSEPFKHEGDNRSPAGIFPITSAFGFKNFLADKNRFPYTHITKYTICVDDAKSRYYNKIINTTKVAQHDWLSAEQMREYVTSYQWGLVVGNNSSLRSNFGSCIFIHVWQDKFHGTAGCTALAKYNMIKILNWIDQSKDPVLIQLPEAVYQRVEKIWHLPEFRVPTLNGRFG